MSRMPRFSGLPCLTRSVIHRPAISEKEPPAATPDFDVATLADRVLAELARKRDRVVLVVDDLHELNSPESLAQLTRCWRTFPLARTRLWPRDVICGCACISCAWPAS